jgi:hypothetical protein
MRLLRVSDFVGSMSITVAIAFSPPALEWEENTQERPQHLRQRTIGDYEWEMRYVKKGNVRLPDARPAIGH